MESKYMLSQTAATLFLSIFILVMLCPGESLCQSAFRLDSTGNKYWDGATWHDVGSDEYESLVRLHDAPQKIYRTGKNISGLGTIFMITGSTVAALGGLSVMVAMGGDGEKIQSTANKMYAGGAVLFVSGVILHFVGQNKIL